MSTSVVLPALGESVTEGTVTRWLKQVGDTIQADEGLLEISTDKVDTEIPSPVSGVIEEILVQEDETVEVGAILAKIGDGWGIAPADAAPAAAGAVADIAFMNPGGLRADLLYGTDGTVSYRDVASVQPFANTITTMTLTGAQIKAVLEEQWQPAGASRPKLHLGVSEGFAYTYVEDAPRGEHIVSMTLHGVAIDPAARYTIATNSFLAGGGDNFTTFAAGTDRADTGQADLSATVAYFAAHGVVDPAPLGRAAIASTEPSPEPSPSDPGTATGGTGSTGSAGQNGGENLANTGTEAPYAHTLGAAALLAAGLLLVAIRRRRVAG